MWRPTQPADPAARAARLVTVAATAVFALIVCRGRPWELFVREGFSNDFYDEQARSFLRLRLAVRPEIAGLEGFLVDGATYLYYGPFLAVARLPFAVFGDVFAGRLARVSMIIAFVVFATGCFHLVRRVAARWGGAATPWRVAGFVAATTCSPVMFLAGWVSVYHETELWAAAFAVWSFAGTIRLLDVLDAGIAPTRHHLLAVGSPIVAGITTRASVGLGVAAGVCLVLAVPPCWSRIVARSGTARHRNEHAHAHARVPTLATGMIAVGAAAVGFAIHTGINWAKFGSPTALPGQLQRLSIEDPARAAWFAGNGDSFFSPRFVETTLVQYLRPDTVRVERLFPFLRYGPLATDRGPYPLETITPSASLTNAATLLVLLAVVGTVMAVRTRAWAVLALTAGGVVAAVPTFTIGFIGNRYLVDMLPMLLAPAALATVTLPLPTPRLRRAARVGVVALVAWGVWCNAALAVWTQQLKEPGFTEWRYRADGWVFGDPAPALVDLVPGAPVPRDGVVVLDRDPTLDRCSAVYIAEQGVLVALERSNDGRSLRGTLRLDGDRTLLAAGDDWGVTAVRTTDGVRLEATVDPAPDGSGGAQALGTPIPEPADGTLAFEVVADPVNGQLFARAGDHSPTAASEAFLFATPQGGALPGPTVDVAPDPGDSLCRQLEARR